ncbi:MAG: hypothetical protein ONB05_01780 [candidate division KSB1 bacterium]|nr:hypothetical protein [candidate division KSB1 bacterium]
MLLEINRSLGKIEGEMAQLRTEIGSLRAETKAEISSLRTEMKVEVKRLDDRIDGLSTGIKWFGGIISSIIIVILGFILNSLFKLARELEPAKKKKERPVPAEKALFIENEMKELKTKMDRIEETLKKSGLTVEP